MKNKLLSVLLAAALLVPLLPALSATAANVTPLTLGVTATGTISGEEGDNEVWFSFTAETDGYYKFSTQSNIDSWVYGRILIYDKNGKTQLDAKDAEYNNLLKVSVCELALYLHKGSYYAMSGGGTSYGTTISITMTVEKVQAKFGEDKEPNESPETAIPFTLGGTAEGNISGVRDDGSYDERDWYIFQAPNAGTYALKLKCAFESTYIQLEFYDSSGATFIHGAFTEYNQLTELSEATLNVDLPNAGKYYICIHSFLVSYRGYINGAYQLTSDGGTALPSTSAAPDLTVEAVTTGTLIRLPAPTTGVGYRVYRSETAGSRGSVIADCLSSNAFVDVNVAPAKTYYYTVEEVFADGTVGAASPENAATAPDDLVGGEIVGNKGFILMTIDDPLMSVNGEAREIDPGRGTVPAIVNGRTLVPIRAIAEAMGGSVDWNEGTRTVTIDCARRQVEMTIDSKIMYVDGSAQEMDIAAQTINDRTVLPVRFVSEALGCAIEWIGSTREVVIVFAAG